jgi:hypothetical protein
VFLDGSKILVLVFEYKTYLIMSIILNTMNLSEDLSVDKELFSGVYEGK